MSLKDAIEEITARRARVRERVLSYLREHGRSHTSEVGMCIAGTRPARMLRVRFALAELEEQGLVASETVYPAEGDFHRRARRYYWLRSKA